MDIEKSIRKSCKKIQKKVMKVSRKLFNINTFQVLFQEMFDLKRLLEENIGKGIDAFTDDDIAKYAYSYAKYKTMKRLCDIVMSFTQLMVLDLHDLEDSWIQENSKE